MNALTMFHLRCKCTGAYCSSDFCSVDCCCVIRIDRSHSIHITQTYHSADCDTDHSLVLSKITLSPKKLHYAKPKGLPKINTSHTNDAERIKHFTSSFESNFHNNLSTDATTNGIISAMQHTKLQWKHMVGGSEIMPTGMKQILMWWSPWLQQKVSSNPMQKGSNEKKIWSPCKTQGEKVNSWQGAVQMNTGWNSTLQLKKLPTQEMSEGCTRALSRQLVQCEKDCST